MPPALLTPAQVGELLQVSARHVCRLAEAGELPAVDLALRGQGRGRHVWRFYSEAIDKEIARRHRPATNHPRLKSLDGQARPA